LPTIITIPIANYSILAKDPNLAASTTMHNGLNVFEEKDEKGRINNIFVTKTFNFNGDLNFNQVG
jgi:hypothetical protein